MGVDSYRYVEQAQQVVAHGIAGLLGVPLESSPLYTLLLAGAVLVAGTSATWVVCIVQAVLGTITVLVLAGLAERAVHSRSAGLATAAVGAVQPTFVFWSSYVLTDTAFLLLVALAADRLHATVAGRHPLRDGFASALLLVVGLVLRPTAAPFAAVAPLFVVCALFPHRKRLFRALAGLLVPALAGAMLSAVAVLTGSPIVGPDSQARLDNYAWSAVYQGLEWTEQGRATAGLDIVVPAEVMDRRPPERAVWFESQSRAWIEHDPGYFAAQVGRKVRAFWSPILPEWSTTHKLLTGGYFAIFYALALVGAWRAWRVDRSFVALLLLGAATFTATSALTIVDYDLRYRLPAEALLLPLAGVGLAEAVARAAPVGGREKPVGAGGSALS